MAYSQFVVKLTAEWGPSQFRSQENYMDFSNYMACKPTKFVNRILIPVNNLSFTDSDVAEFNEIYKYCLDLIESGDLKEFVLTPSGGFSQKIEHLRGGRYQIVVKKTFVEIVIRNLDGYYYRFQIGHEKLPKKGSREKPNRLVGHQAFRVYVNELKKDGVDLNDYAVDPDEGRRIKSTIPSPIIKLCVVPGRTFENAYHLDFNSAFNAGMMKKYPFLETTVRRLYNLRNKNPIYKDVLNMTQGYMQSELIKCRYAHISKAGHVWTVEQLNEMTKRLQNNGYRILSYNTDGIWYQSFNNSYYHDENEGYDIGQWKTDHKNCTIRYKSKGCYEFIENGKYTPIFRGESSYEKIKHRDNWEWGDIFKGDTVGYSFVEGEGIVKDDTK